MTKTPVRLPILIVSLFFLIGGVAHFVVPEFFIQSMPDYLAYHWPLVIISGTFELLGALGVLLKKSRVLAAYGLMALCFAVFPANINMALHAELFPEFPAYILYLRLPLQGLIIGFIFWSIKPERLS